MKIIIICCWYMKNIKKMRNIFINWYTVLDQPEVAFMKKVLLRS